MRIVTGLFSDPAAVDLAIEHMVQEFGVRRDRIQVHSSDPASGAETRSPQDDDQTVALSDLPLPEHLTPAYREGVRQGAILLLAYVDDSRVDHVLALCREYGAANPEAFGASRVEHTSSESVRLRAYFLWEEAGRPEGRDVEFWKRAEANNAEGSRTRSPQESSREPGSPG